MWESLIQRPRGSSSLWRLFTFVTTLIVISFVYLIASAPTASAADAEFKNGTMTYDGQTFSGPFTADGANPKGIAKDIKYFSTPKAGDPTRATLLLLPLNKQPADATTATLQEADVSSSGRFSNLSPPKTITVGTASDSDSETTETESSCKIDGVGWIVCSMSKWIAEGVDYLYGIIAKFLMFEPLTTSGSTSSIYQLWSVVRNIANLAFIIAFILVIYSQLSGGGFSNYTVKRILPRIFIAAILVNASFWISAIAIDISNILGVSVQNIFKNSLAGVGAANTVDLPLWGDVTAAILSGTGLTIGGAVLLVSIGGTVGGLAFLLLGALIPAIFAALVAVAILAARQAIITLLVIISPLAFVAFILPNTEEWFDKWRKAFLTLLIMFPLFSAIFGGSQLIGNIIIQNARDISVALLGLTVQVVPLFLTPLLIKFSSGVLGTIAGMTNDKGRGVFDRAKNWADGNRKLHQQRGLSKRPPATRRGNLRPTSLAQRVNNRRLYREQMTAAHESKAEAQFAETDRGRQVHHRNKDAKLRSHAAEEASGLDWNRQVYGVNGMRHSHRAGLHHAAHMHAGESKLITDRATSHAERDLQTHINNTPALRNMKIQADVDSAHAKFQASNMEAEAKMVFDGEVLASRALRNMAVQTNEFNKRAETAQADVQSRADAHWSHLSNTDPVIRQQKLNTYEASQSAKLAEEQWNTIITNIEAAGSAAPNLNAGEARIANSIKQVTEHISIEGYAKSNAETEKKKRLTDTLLKNTTVINGQTVREYAGGIRGTEGAESVLASAVAASRKEYGERVAEKTQLIKHFNPASDERQELAMGIRNVTGRKDGSTYVFDMNDEYTREAMIEEQLKAGSFGQIEDIIMSSGIGEVNENWRTTISAAIVGNGLANKALYFGSKTIDDVAQGRIKGDASLYNAALYHIREGKIKDSVLASQSSTALERMFKLAQNPSLASDFAALSPDKQQAFVDRAQALRDSAKRILDDRELRAQADEATIEVLNRYKSS